MMKLNFITDHGSKRATWRWALRGGLRPPGLPSGLRRAPVTLETRAAADSRAARPPGTREPPNAPDPEPAEPDAPGAPEPEPPDSSGRPPLGAYDDGVPPV